MKNNWWMVRASNGKYTSEFIEDGKISIGYGCDKALSLFSNKLEIIDYLKTKFLNTNPRSTHTTATQLYKFCYQIKKGDAVITYDSAERKYYVGIISGEYHFDLNAEPFFHSKEVTWNQKAINRDSLSIKARNSLGATLTIFSINDDIISEFDSILHGKIVNKTLLEVLEYKEEIDEEEIILETAAEAQFKASEQIKDYISGLKWDVMQELVAGILRAMGYKTRVSPSGSDRGVDIVASPDGLGFEQPRIVVEVKHRKNAMGAPEIRGFLGGRHHNDKGLYVSTGGFTKEARYEADRANIPLTLIDIDDLVELILEHYPAMDSEAKNIIPLKPVYWLAQA